MRTMHYQNHAASEYVLYVGIDRNGGEFIRIKHIHLLTYRHLTLYVSTNNNEKNAQRDANIARWL